MVVSLPDAVAILSFAALSSHPLHPPPAARVGFDLVPNWFTTAKDRGSSAICKQNKTADLSLLLRPTKLDRRGYRLLNGRLAPCFGRDPPFRCALIPPASSAPGGACGIRPGPELVHDSKKPRIKRDLQAKQNSRL